MFLLIGYIVGLIDPLKPCILRLRMKVICSQAELRIVATVVRIGVELLVSHRVADTNLEVSK